jgi:hypothetical protein
VFGPTGYAIVSGLMFAGLIAGAYFLFGREKANEDEPEVDEDPMITGERRGLGFAALQVVGGVLAVPFVLYNSGLKLLDKLATLAPEPKKKDDAPKDSSAD